MTEALEADPLLASVPNIVSHRKIVPRKSKIVCWRVSLAGHWLRVIKHEGHMLKEKQNIQNSETATPTKYIV